MKLVIDLIPKTSFFKNLRSELTSEEWDRIRRQCYKKAGYRCEVCEGVGPKWPVECHEIWSYDEASKIQSLKGLIALCPMCHATKHIGLSTLRGMRGECVNHLMKVNDWSEDQCEDHIAEAFDIWRERNEVEWVLDLKYLESLK